MIDTIRSFCDKRNIEPNAYYSILLSMLYDRVILYDGANKDLVEILLKEIILRFRKRFAIYGYDFQNIL